MKKWLFLMLFTISSFAYSQQFTYRPVNPAFGGDTFNYQWLLSSATAQNGFKEDVASRDRGSDLENFSSTLNRQLLSQLSRSLLTSQIGTDGLQPGTFSAGSLEVEVYETLEGLVVNILDTDTGEQTQFIVPNN